MKKLIDIYYMRGWSKKERREFWVSLFATILFCAVAFVLLFVFQCAQEGTTENIQVTWK